MGTTALKSGRDSPLLVLLLSSRPAVWRYVESLDDYLPGLMVLPLDLELDIVEDHERTLALVDVALDPNAGIEACRELRERFPDVPIAVLLCCPQAVDPWQLQTLFSSGVGSVLDLQAKPEEGARLLESAAGGSAVIHLHIRRSHRTLLRDLFVDHGSRRGARLRLLQLVARGLPDHEIGRILHLSPHTVKHHIESLRADLGVRNRTELAAWAGRHGFYDADGDGAGDAVPVDLARPGRR
jgi:DNA-binding NarL/FixJ family response regulator